MSILSLQKRQREIGRLRLGDKAVSKTTGNPYPVSLDTWRLTSPSRELIYAAAEAYGGTPDKWNDQWEVVTKTASLPVMVPPQEVRQNLELWSRGGLVRRCDGSTCYSTTDKPDIMVESACLCADQDDSEPSCSPATMLKFYLVDLPGLGVWVLTSTGWSVASELAADVEMLAGRNIRATLSIEHRERKHAGQTKRFTVPILEIPISLTDLLKQGAALPAPQVSALPTSRKEPLGAPVTDVPSPSVGEERPEGPGRADIPAVSNVIEGLVERIEMVAWDTLNGLLGEGAPKGTMESNETKLRLLFRSLGQTGLIPDSDKALHDSLGKRGLYHVSELKAAELIDFCGKAWVWAQGLVDKGQEGGE